MPRLSIAAGTLLAAAILLAACASLAPKAQLKMDPEAEAALRAMSDKLAAAPHFQFQSLNTYDPAIAERINTFTKGRVHVSVTRPNRLHADVLSADANFSQAVYLDGTSLTIHDRIQNLYAVAPMKKPTLDAALDRIADHYGFVPPLADFLVADPFSGMTVNMHTGRHQGTKTVDGVSCDHLAFTGDEFDWELWIATGDRLPRQYVITAKFLKGNPQFTAKWSNWNLGAEIPDNTFTFTPPKGAHEIRMLSVADVESTPPVRLRRSHQPSN